MAFSVLFVCTGNICRSPTAERLFQARMRPDADVRVRSAGTGAVVGHEMDANSAAALRRLGGDPTGHVGAQLTRGDVESADLILTASRRHCSVIVHETPTAMRRVFTLREFARLGAGVDADGDLATRVAAVAAQRDVVDPPEPGEDEIVDPIGESLEVVDVSAQQVSAAVDDTLRVLGLSGS